MSYKEKPILKLYKYENNSFVLQAQIDDYQEVSWENNLYEAGQFSITINYNIPNASLFERGLFINFGDSYEFGEILKIQDSIGEDGAGSQLRVITGYDARYILKRRVIKNMNNNGLWTMTGKGELVIRNLIADQAGANAEEKRRLPIVNTIPYEEDAIGKEYSASEQFSNLYEVCKTIATQSEVGWRIEFDGTSLTLVFFSGEDRSQVVRFDTSYESLANGTFVDSGEAFSNAIYVGGKGQNDDRDIYEGENAIEGNAPSGLDRFECWDNQSSMTTEDEYEAEALAMLTQYGQTITLSGNGLAKCPYEYEKEYNVGDKITVAFSGKSAVVQILSVTEHWAFASYDLNFSFGKPQPDLNAQLQLILKQIQKASNKTNSKDSVRWYTIPTDTEMPASDVTYTHIGFIGDVGNDGKTFTLYRDTSGTGSKTYHVYFKQLAGSGKLTLTTGVSGASNLVLNPGTYVIIIYVDENGNITSQGMTATSTIESGNSQPVESGAVANSISQEVSDRNTAIENAINALDVSEVGGDGKYISAISEIDGKIIATETTMDTTPTVDSTKAVTSDGIFNSEYGGIGKTLNSSNWYKIAEFGVRNTSQILEINLLTTYNNTPCGCHHIVLDYGWLEANVFDFSKDTSQAFDKIKLCYNSNDNDRMAIYVHYRLNGSNNRASVSIKGLNTNPNTKTVFYPYNFVTDELVWGNTKEFSLGADGLYINGKSYNVEKYLKGDLSQETLFAGDLNDIQYGNYFISSASTNLPPQENSAGFLMALYRSSAYQEQLAFFPTTANVYSRSCFNGTWGKWNSLKNIFVDKYMYYQNTALTDPVYLKLYEQKLAGVNYFAYPIHLQGECGLISNDVKTPFDITIDFRTANTTNGVIRGYSASNMSPYIDIIPTWDNDTTTLRIYVAIKVRYAFIKVQSSVPLLSPTEESNMAGVAGTSMFSRIINVGGSQPKTLSTPITIGGQSYTTVESALQALAGLV